MTPAARLAAAIELLGAFEAQQRRPADAIVNEFFRARRFIGGGDRRDVSDRVWAVVRERLRLDWHLGQAGTAPTPRLLAAAHLILSAGDPLESVVRAFSGEGHGEPPLSVAERRVLAALRGPLVRRDMPDAARLNVPEWALSGFRDRFGEALPEAAAAMCGAAPLDLRANALRGGRDAARAALAAEGISSEIDLLFALGAAAGGASARAGHARLQGRTGGDPGRGQPADRLVGRCPARRESGRLLRRRRAARRWPWPPP